MIEEHNGRFFVALYNPRNGQYEAPMNKSARELTGCYAVVSRDLSEIFSSPNVTKYRNRASAKRAATRIFYGEVQS